MTTHQTPPPTQERSCTLQFVGSADLEDYLLAPWELRLCGYPLPSQPPPGYQLLPPPPDDAPSRIFGLDCELVLTTSGPALARISLVQLPSMDLLQMPPPPGSSSRPRPWSGRLVWDALIQPEAPVVDHLTPHSGILPRDLERTTLTRAQALGQLMGLVHRGDVLCGHGLHNDLHALGLVHARLLDTLALYPHPHGPPSGHSLRLLAQSWLGRTIQTPHHACPEDAAAALELAVLKIQRRQGRLQWRPVPNGEPAIFLKAPPVDLALRLLALEPDQVRACYLRGSRAVGTAGVRDDGSVSDWDLVVVLDNASLPDPMEDVHVSHGNLDAALYDEDTFVRLLKECTVWALECIFAPYSAVWKQDFAPQALFARYWRELPTPILLARLRRSVSYEASRQWSKARIYLQQKEDDYSCRKRIFIALRYLTYGIELARTGAIQDLGCINDLWEEQLKHPQGTDWEHFGRVYGPIYKDLHQRFKQATPKQPRYGGFRSSPGPTLDHQRSPLTQASAAAPQKASATGTGPAIFEEARGQPVLDVVRYLRARGPEPGAALEALWQEFGIGARYHARHPELVQLRYSPRSQPVDHPIVTRCRGLILDISRGWEVVAYPFDRFFNHNTLQAPELDWSTARISPKLDGSLAALYWWRGRWRVASSRRPDGEGRMCLRDPGGPLAFHRLFQEIWDRSGYKLPPEPTPARERMCYLFELTSRRHPIIVRYPDEALHLLGARSLDTFQEHDPAPIAARHGWACVNHRPLPWAPGDDVAPGTRVHSMALGLDASLQEGFVVRDARWRRLKFKSPAYVRMSWMFPLCPNRAGVNERRLLYVALAGAGAEFVAYCPEHRDLFRQVQARLARLHHQIQTTWSQLSSIKEDRLFARQALEHPFSRVLFGMRHHGSTIEAELKRIPLKNLEEIIQKSTNPDSDEALAPTHQAPAWLQPATGWSLQPGQGSSSGAWPDPTDPD